MGRPQNGMLFFHVQHCCFYGRGSGQTSFFLERLVMFCYVSVMCLLCICYILPCVCYAYGMCLLCIRSRKMLFGVFWVLISHKMLFGVMLLYKLMGFARILQAPGAAVGATKSTRPRAHQKKS